MKVEYTNIEGLVVFVPTIFNDGRGSFSESFRRSNFVTATQHDKPFVQDNQSVSLHKNTIRGLHLQAPPHAQGKLVRCTRGRVLDVAVDVRATSDTYGQYFSIELSEKNGRQLWVPPGFLHGFQTLEDNTHIVYKCDTYYHPECEMSVSWKDPSLSIDWHYEADTKIVSDKDRHAPTFSAFDTPF